MRARLKNWLEIYLSFALTALYFKGLPLPRAGGGDYAASGLWILNLQLGPIHLDLLGPVLDTNQIIVTLNAVSGAGNLLGNLLCAVTNLLNGGIGGALNQIVDLLNQILAAL